MNRHPSRLAALLIAALLAGCSPVHVITPEERIQAREFLWPVSGTVSSGFGYRSSGRHEGIDILAPLGTPVLAADRGIVSYAGNGMRGYGNAVILDHGNGLTTLYGHLDTIRVKAGDVVPSSAPIGTVGRTGNATTYHVHFELRIDGKAVNPIGCLAGYPSNN